ncbi:MAG: DUF4240 domain-containing protein [Pseudomonadales bacterium]|jgi:predicted DNA-binding WGR domain protein|nr:DUF4240 domain-containing protein [Pseudomonadales bacterium]
MLTFRAKAMKREFYFQDDRSNKFWTIECMGTELVTANGRVGARARETKKTFATESEAQKEFERLIASKLKNDYIEGVAPPYKNPEWSTMAMTEEVFWRLIALLNWKKTGDDSVVLEPVVKALAQMSVVEIHKFEDILAEKLHALDTREYCRACYRGELDPDDGDDYISPDDFLYSRCVVVANGENFYASVLNNPEKMPQDMEFESLLSLPVIAYERKTGNEYEHTTPVSYESFQNVAGWAPTVATRSGKYTDESIPPGNRRPT